MKKIVFLSLLCLFFACDDGDLQIETLDFDSVDPQSCETTMAGEATVLFKINGDEALILELAASVLKNEVANDVETNVTADGNTKVTYRIFDGSLNNAYFCSAVPLTSPILTEEIQAQAGKVIVTTTTEDNTTFTHNIRLSDITLLTDADTRITDLTINDFGVITTAITE